MGANFTETGYKIAEGAGKISCIFETTPVRPGPYHFNIDIFEEDRLIYRQKEIGPLIVTPD